MGYYRTDRVVLVAFLLATISGIFQMLPHLKNFKRPNKFRSLAVLFVGLLTRLGHDQIQQTLMARLMWEAFNT